MFKKKKLVAAIEIPPKVVKQTANYRLVQSQLIGSFDFIKNQAVTSSYYNILTLEKRNTDAMLEPQWVFCCRIQTDPSTQFSCDQSAFIKECFMEKV